MNRPLWQLSEVAKATGAADTFSDDRDINGISIDSRTIEPGDLYVAIVGDVHDGHKFIPNALEAGAAACLASHDYEADANVSPLVRVPDTLRGMEALGVASRARTSATVIAVTGSVGKTGTKEALKLCLEDQGQTHASVKSFNNHWGVPLTLARMPEETRFGVFEIGMNHPGEITPLTKMVRPHIAIITTVAPVHIGFFDSVEQIAAAKAEIFDGLEADGAAVLNIDNPHYEFLKERAESVGANVVSFGTHSDANARLLNIDQLPDRSEAEADILGQNVKFTVGSPGKHLVLNSLAVLVAVKLAGGDLEQAAKTLENYKPQQGRGSSESFSRDGRDILIVDESYNANPASMRSAIETFSQSTADRYKRRIIVLGDMLELGKDGPELHKALVEPINSAEIDQVFACGPLMEELFSVLPSEKKGIYASDSSALLPQISEAISSGDAIMIKGSLGSRMGLIVEALKKQLR